MYLKNLLPLLLLALLPAISFAGSKTSTMKPTATVSNDCLINSTDNLSFGAYVPSNSAALQTSGQIKLTCTKGATVSVYPVSGGSHMQGGGSTLTYVLYSDSAMSSVWGNQPTIPFDSNSTGSTFFATQTLVGDGELSIAQIQQIIPSFNPNTVYGYFYQTCCASNGTSIGRTWIFTGYQGQTSGSLQLGPAKGYTLVTDAPETVVPGSNSAGTYYKIVPTSLTGVNGVYQVPTGPMATLSGTSTQAKTPMVLTYYGKVPALQDVTPGTYTDTVTIQVAF